MLYMYGFSKLLHLQFNLHSQLAQRPIGLLTGYELTWYYFGYSRAYASILGLTQAAGATLLLFRKTTLLAALMMTPVMANILLINIFIMVNDYGPYLMSALIFGSMMRLLWHERMRLVTVLWPSDVGEPAGSRRTHGWIRVLIVLLASGIMMAGWLMQRYYPRK